MAAKICGPDAALGVGITKEVADQARYRLIDNKKDVDLINDSWKDLKANWIGITCPATMPCSERCKPLAPIGMPLD